MVRLRQSPSIMAVCGKGKGITGRPSINTWSGMLDNADTSGKNHPPIAQISHKKINQEARKGGGRRQRPDSAARCPYHLFSDGRRFLAFAGSKVIQSGAANATLLLHLDFCDSRRMQRENALDALAVRDSAYGECFVKSAAFTANHYACEYLDSFLVPFRNASMNAHAVADGKLRRVASSLFFLDGIDDLTHDKIPSPSAGRANSFQQDR